jgi:hypothetical protein
MRLARCETSSRSFHDKPYVTTFIPVYYFSLVVGCVRFIDFKELKTLSHIESIWHFLALLRH